MFVHNIWQKVFQYLLIYIRPNKWKNNMYPFIHERIIINPNHRYHMYAYKYISISCINTMEVSRLTASFDYSMCVEIITHEVT